MEIYISKCYVVKTGTNVASFHFALRKDNIKTGIEKLLLALSLLTCPLNKRKRRDRLMIKTARMMFVLRAY